MMMIYFIILMRNYLLKKAGLSDHPNNELQVLFLSPPLLLSTTQENQVEIFVAHHMEWQDIIHKMQPCRKNAVPPLLHSYLLRAGTVSGFEISGQSMKIVFSNPRCPFNLCISHSVIVTSSPHKNLKTLGGTSNVREMLSKVFQGRIRDLDLPLMFSN